MKDDQAKQLEAWTKLQIYEAYLLEYNTRIKLNKELNEARRELAKMKYDLKQLSI